MGLFEAPQSPGKSLKYFDYLANRSCLKLINLHPVRKGGNRWQSCLLKLRANILIASSAQRTLCAKNLDVGNRECSLLCEINQAAAQNLGGCLTISIAGNSERELTQKNSSQTSSKRMGFGLFLKTITIQ
jgi:hypothetical protein